SDTRSTYSEGRASARPTFQRAQRRSRRNGTCGSTSLRGRRSRLVIQQRQTNRETGADLRSAVDFDRAVVIFDHLLGDVEPEAGAALALFGREIRIENLRHLRRRNSVPGILNPNIDVKIFP